jgi:hypothetical protein
MLQPNYTDKEKKLFTGRNSYLKQLEGSITKNKTAAILANSGFGRTTLLKHFAAKHNVIYIDLKKLSLSPENFAVDFIGTICFLHLSKKPAELLEYKTIEKLKQLKLGAKCSGIISKIDNELQKIRPNQELILKSAFMFAEEFAAEQGKSLTIAINNFEELLKLNNFSQIKDILGIFFDSIEKNTRSSFILASSAVNLMKNLLKKFIPAVVEMSSFTPQETKELFEKIAGKTDDRITKEVHSLSAGLPLIVKETASRYQKEKSSDTQKNIHLINYIVASELANSDSPSYSYCSKLFTNSLNRARGEALLKTVLKAVSQNQPLRLTEIARLVYRSGPVTKSILERLVEVDLITKTGTTFDFANPVLKQWCRLMFSNIEFSETPDEKTLKELGGL